MKQVEKSGKTVEEAVEAALLELEATKSEVEIQVLEEPSKGLFGLIGTKLAKVLVTVKEGTTTPPQSNLEESVAAIIKDSGNDSDSLTKAKVFLEGLFEKMDLEVEVTASKKDDYVTLDFAGPDLGILIGRRGDTLDALQYLTNLVANKNMKERSRFILDVEGYRKRREETLDRLANRLADKVKRKGRDVVLEPMNPHERRIIHTALQNHKEVFTYSEGEEPFRKIIIAPKK